MLADLVQADCCFPFPAFSIPGHALEPAAIIHTDRPVLLVLRSRGLSQIEPPIIRLISIYVVNNFWACAVIKIKANL